MQRTLASSSYIIHELIFRKTLENFENIIFVGSNEANLLLQEYLQDERLDITKEKEVLGLQGNGRRVEETYFRLVSHPRGGEARE